MVMFDVPHCTQRQIMTTELDYYRVHVPTLGGKPTTIALDPIITIELCRFMPPAKLNEAAGRLSLEFDGRIARNEKCGTRNSYVSLGLKELIPKCDDGVIHKSVDNAVA